jgi:hypothetical protein
MKGRALPERDEAADRERTAMIRTLSLVSCLAIAASAIAQKTPAPASPPAPSQPSDAAPRPPILDEMIAQAKSIRPLFQTPDVLAFLDAASLLPDPGPRTIWVPKDKAAPRVVRSQAQYEALDDAARATLTKKALDATFYYSTGFGFPAIYARPLDLALRAGDKSLRGKRILDFGYGMIAHMRQLAALGNDVHGVDVWDILPVLYGEPMDTGSIAGAPAPDGPPGTSGTLTLHNGRWPAEPDLVKAVGDRYDLIISKNVLKRGYIHPQRETDPKFLITLGVDDPAFLHAMHEALKPGGIAIIYNISPPQNPDDKPYLPHADPRCPFPREMIEKAGFEVIEYDTSDDEFLRPMWVKMGLSESNEKAQAEIFSRYTLLRRAAK